MFAAFWSIGPEAGTRPAPGLRRRIFSRADGMEDDRPAGGRQGGDSEGLPTSANGAATRSNNTFTGSDPSRSRAWKIADFDGNFTGSASGNDHANPSVDKPTTSSEEPSECSAIPTAKYATTHAGNNRCRCSVRPASAITSSTTPGGNTRVNNPTDTRSDNRRSDSGFTQQARATHPNYTPVF